MSCGLTKWWRFCEVETKFLITLPLTALLSLADVVLDIYVIADGWYTKENEVITILLVTAIRKFFLLVWTKFI